MTNTSPWPAVVARPVPAPASAPTEDYWAQVQALREQLAQLHASTAG